MSFQGQAKPPLSDRDRRELPVEIAFLERHGFFRDLLERAAGLAREADVWGDEALLANGLLDEATFYRALAAELRVPFLARVEAGPGARCPDSILIGLVALAPHEPARFAMAPAGARLSWLLAAGRPLPPGLALTTPTALREAVLAAKGPEIADEAANTLVREAPRFSFKGGPSAGQLAAAALLAVGSGLAAAQAWAALMLALIVLASAAFLAMVALRLAAAQYGAPVEAPRLPRADDRDLPVYTVLVPLHRESRILPQLLAALSALDYPAAKLDVKLVLEEGDAETRAALARLRPPPFVEVLVAPPGEPRTKPRALNVALPLARGEYLVVYDAEDRPEPGQLRQAAASFDRLGADVACLQGRLVIDNTADSWLTRLFTLEYAALFDVLNPFLAAWRFPVPLGGTSTHFRTAALVAAGGWDAWNVTEDADLGIRLAVLGYRVADLPCATLEEAPATIPAWMHQRARWMKGYMQVCITHSRHPIRTFRALGPGPFLAAVALTFGTVATALAFPVCTLLTLDALLDGRVMRQDTIPSALSAGIGLVLFAAGLVAIWAPALVGVCRRRFWTLLPWVALLPFYYVLASAAAWRGAWELLRSPFRWNKTEHGLALTSRAGAITAGAGAPRPRPRAAG